ncbi:hypothetical protein [Zooshikella harenae]|uniref:Uncharacterized protein n=1 Tax=Zooshikella harenae TaxID=2827238 RepID=A0ABS5ZAC8_9GAMM|nr:hypothetical protein [Zooshikella harenae]MBU2711017.1 hypothetical protein [Zooshikella harenae]
MLKLSQSCLLLLSVLLVGCGTQGTRSGGGFSSVSPEDAPFDYKGDDYAKRLGAYEAQFKRPHQWLTGENGQYYFAFFDAAGQPTGLTSTQLSQASRVVKSQLIAKPYAVATFFIPSGDHQLIKRLLKQQKGLLTPAYKLTDELEIIPDIDRTTRLFHEYRNNYGLRLASLKNTLKYHVRFVASVESQCPTRESQGITSCVMQSWMMSNSLSNVFNTDNPYNVTLLNRLLNQEWPKLGYILLNDQPVVESPAVVNMKFANSSKSMKQTIPAKRAQEIKPYWNRSRWDIVIVKNSDQSRRELAEKMTEESAYCEVKLLPLEALDQYNPATAPNIHVREKAKEFTDNIAQQFCGKVIQQLAR